MTSIPFVYPHITSPPPINTPNPKPSLINNPLTTFSLTCFPNCFIPTKTPNLLLPNLLLSIYYPNEILIHFQKYFNKPTITHSPDLSYKYLSDPIILALVSQNNPFPQKFPHWPWSTTFPFHKTPNYSIPTLNSNIFIVNTSVLHSIPNKFPIPTLIINLR